MFKKSERLYEPVWFWLLWLLIGAMPALCQAEFQDPTKPDSPKIIINTSPHNTDTEEKLVLSAIWITTSGKWATINGTTAKQGQTILNKIKIIKISRNTVFLSYSGRIKKLRLLHSLSKSQ